MAGNGDHLAIIFYLNPKLNPESLPGKRVAHWPPRSGSLRRHYPVQVHGSFALARKTLSVTPMVMWLPDDLKLGRTAKSVKHADDNKILAASSFCRAKTNFSHGWTDERGLSQRYSFPAQSLNGASFNMEFGAGDEFPQKLFCIRVHRSIHGYSLQNYHLNLTFTGRAG
jgi:hypothetical protein